MSSLPSATRIDWRARWFSLLGKHMRTTALLASLVSILTLTPADVHARPRLATTAQACRPAAISLTETAATTKIHWENVSSDLEAASCLFAVARQLGKRQTLKWLQASSFNAMFIEQFHANETLLSAGWPIHERGLLYRTGPLAIIQSFLAYSQVFSFTWDSEGNLQVSWSYTYE